MIFNHYFMGTSNVIFMEKNINERFVIAERYLSWFVTALLIFPVFLLTGIMGVLSEGPLGIL